MTRIYNEEVKERFLSTYENEQTQKTIRHVFLKSQLVESILEKDLYNFNINEIGKVIENANPHNSQTARSLGRFITQYISWAMPYRESNLSPFHGIDNSWYDKFVDQTKKIHYSYDEILLLLENMQNGQDQAFIFLIFEGIIGQNFSELKSLHSSDIDWDTHEIYVKERDKKIKVSEDCIKYLDKACKEKTYFTFNKKTTEHNEKELLPSEFVFKNIKSPRGKEFEMVNHTVFYNRLASLREEFELEYLTPNAIKQSGMIKMAADIYEKEGKLEYEQFEKIGEKYNYSMVTNNGYSYFNTTLMKEFISESNLKELYNIDIKF